MHLGSRTGLKPKSIEGHCSQTSVCLRWTSLQQREGCNARGKYPRSLPQKWRHWYKRLEPPTPNPETVKGWSSRQPALKHMQKKANTRAASEDHRWDWGSRCSSKAANNGDSSFTGLPCTLVAVLPVLLPSIQEIWMCYLIFLLTIAAAHSRGLGIIFLTLFPRDLWFTLLVPQISEKQMKLYNSSFKAMNILKKGFLAL